MAGGMSWALMLKLGIFEAGGLVDFNRRDCYIHYIYIKGIL